MRIITKFLLFSLILIFCLATVSATENITDNDYNGEVSISQQLVNDNVENTIKQDNYETKSIEKNKDTVNDNKTTKEASSIITVTQNNYDQFFTQESGDMYPKTTDMIRDGDTLNLKGTFVDKIFMVDKNITFTSKNNDAKLYNCTIYVIGEGASGSTISNMDIFNEGTLKRGIQVKYASNITVKNNHVVTYGLRAYGFVADHMNDSLMESNYFERDGDDWRYIAFVIGQSHHNTIANNTIICGANGIYLSIYGSYEANFDGGACNYNTITGNKITARGYITSWCYNIQVMGAYNTVTYNTVIGGFRGISTQDYVNNFIAYNDIQAINEGIYACENATVINNNVHVNQSATGITIGSDNVVVANNTINSMNGYGIDIRANNVLVANNTITSTGSYGIYAKGKYNGIVIDNNKINSYKDGILFKHQTRTKKINDIYVNKNNINSQSDYAINFEEAGAYDAIDVNVTVTSSNVLSSVKGKGSVAYLPPANSNSSTQLDSDQQITITPQNYTQWFTDSTANSNIQQNATITLKGKFTNTDFIFNKKTHVIGDNCQIINGTITFTADAHQSSIKNIKFTNNEATVTKHAIELLEVNNCEITDVEIKNYADYESMGIFLYGANGNTIKNNRITTSGDYANDAIFLYGSDQNVIYNNTIKLNQSSLKVEYADSIMFNEKIGTITEVLHNHGIMLVYSSNNDINKNNINITSMFDSYTFPTNDCKNSVVGIDVYFESHKNRIRNNDIYIKSFGPYVYGMGVLGGQWGSSILTSNATANEYINNNLDLTGGYYVTGFIAGRNSVNTLVKSNTFSLTAYKNSKSMGDYAQTIVLENSTDSDIINNKMTSTATALYNIELFDSNNNNIINNTINGRATNPYGIAGSRSSNNNIISNTFILRKEELGNTSSAQHSDSIEVGDEAIMFNLESVNNNIKLNTINTNATTAVKLTKETRNNNVTENSLVAKELVSDQAVLDYGTNNRVSNNFVHFVNATANPVQAYIGDTITLVANINTTTSDYTNLSVTFKLGANTVGTSNVVKGKASVKYNVSTLWNPTTYQITAYVRGNNFQNATAISQAVFDKHPDKTNVNVAKVLATVGSNAKLSAEITTLSGGKVGSGEAEFYVDGVKIDTVTPRLGVATCTYPIANDAENKLHTIDVVYIGTSDYDNSTGSNILGVQSISALSVANHTATIDKIANIKADITSGDKKVASGKVNIFIDNTKLTTATISKGEINTNVTIPTTFDKGSHTLKIVYDGNDTLSSATGSATIKLNPITPVFHYNTTEVSVGANASLVLVIDNGKTGSDLFTANDGNVSVKLNDQLLKDSSGKVIYGTMKNGKLTFKFTAPAQLTGSQNLTFIYTGNSQFANANKTYVNGLKIGKTNVKITINKIANVKYNDNVTITGKFTEDNGKAISNTNLNVSINGKQYKTKTDGNGVYNFSTQVKTVGVNNVTVSYAGNTNYNSYVANSTFTVKQPTWIKTASMANVEIGTTVKIVGRLLSNVTGQAIKYAQVTVKVNNETYQLKTDGAGYVRLNYTVNDYNVQKVIFKYNGNSLNLASSNSTSFKVKQPTWIKIANMANVDYGSTVKVVGRLLNNNSAAVKYAYVNVTVNNKVYKVKTDGAGYIRLNYTVNNYDVQKITFKFAGNNLYAASTNSTSFKVKQPTWIKIGYLGNVPYGSTVKVVARLLSGSTPVKYVYVNVTVNNKVYKVKTDGAGYIRLNYTVNSYDDQKITFKFAGNNLYAASTNSTTFKVKQPTLIKHASIGKVKQGSIVKFTGRLLYNETNPVKYVQVNVTVNGKVYNLKTDGAGYFRLNYTATTVGTFTFISKFGGNNLYLASTNSTKFTVVKS